MTVDYSAGEWSLACAAGGWGVFAPEVSVVTVARAWRALRSGTGFGGVLEALVGDFGTSFTALPPFAVVIVGPAGEAQIVVRGSTQVGVVSGGEHQTVSGAGVTTWQERIVQDVDSITWNSIGSAEPRPLVDGVVTAGAVRWGVADAVAPIAAEPTLPDRVMGSSVELTAADEPVDPPIDAAPSELEPQHSFPAQSISIDVPAPPREDASEEPVRAAPVLPDATAVYLSETQAELSDHTTTYDDLVFGETRMSSVEDAAVRAAPGEDALLISGIPAQPARARQADSDPQSEGSPGLGDHDGETISATQLAALRAQLATGARPTPSTPVAAAAMMTVSDGQRVALDRSVVVGRKPRAVRASGTVPHLVEVASPQQDISRSHVELRVEGRDIVAVDLDTTNGTRLLRVGSDPVRLQPGDPTLLVVGDRLDLGDGVTLEFEGI